ncbi:MAG: helix-turn-helix domain-containing protein [Ensifer adhaerens]
MALASIYDGGSRRYASAIGGVTVQIVRDWVLRLNERGPGGLINGKAPDGRAKLNDAQRQALAKIVESGPIPAVHGVVRWRRRDPVQWLFQGFRVSIDETTVGWELKALALPNFRPVKARRSAVEDHVHRTARLGASVMISARWYYSRRFAARGQVFRRSMRCLGRRAAAPNFRLQETA